MTQDLQKLNSLLHYLHSFGYNAFRSMYLNEINSRTQIAYVYFRA